MRRIALKSVIPGQTIAKTIFSSKGKLLLEVGSILSIKNIAKLKNLNIEDIYIEEICSEENSCTNDIL